MKTLLAVLLLLSAGAARAEFSPLQVAEPQPRPADVITKNHMLAQAGKNSLYGWADTRAQFQEAAEYWGGVLRDAGLEPGTPTYNEGFYVLPYRAPAGKTVRAFLAEARQFPPKDENGLRANMALAEDALRAAGMPVISARVLNLDTILPTYQILYLAAAADKPEHESLLRVLKPGDDLDEDMIRLSGVTVVQRPEKWMLVYVGPELGYVGMIGHTREEAEAKLAKRSAFLVENGKRIIGSKIEPLDDPEWKFGVALYFFQ